MEIKEVNIDQLEEYQRNAKEHTTKQIKQIGESIKEFGFQQPIVIDKNNVIIIGHGRYRAAKYLGLDKVPVVYADNLSEEQVKALRMADNKLNESSWNEGLLDLELFELKDFGMYKFGFDIPENEEINKKNDSQKIYEEMQLKAFEHHDYIVFVFDNQMDWLKVVNEFGIKKVDAGYGSTKKVGVGRVIDGKRLLEKI